jgi:6-phospho-3-hexuloisomerase
MTSLETTTDRILDELRRVLHSVDSDDLDQLKQLLLDTERIFIVGKGRSGLQMNGFAMRLMHLGLSVHVVGSVTTPNITANDLLLIGSGSGRTASLVQYAKRAHALGARIALITTAHDSPIHAYTSHVIRVDATTPKIDDDYNSGASVLPMGSIFEHTLGLLLDICVSLLMHDLNLDSDQMFTRHANLE